MLSNNHLIALMKSCKLSPDDNNGLLEFAREVERHARTEALEDASRSWDIKMRDQKTLRDEFAMAFISGDSVAFISGDSDWLDYEKMVKIAYLVADAMMEARK